MLLNEFVKEVRTRLCQIGLPLNGGWQPDRASVHAMYANGESVEDVVRNWAPRALAYEDWVNRSNPDYTPHYPKGGSSRALQQD
jgi:hypothetical protein